MPGEPTDTTAGACHPRTDAGSVRSRSPGQSDAGADDARRGTDTDAQSRGVSYALGFVLVFSIVLGGTLALFAVGVDVLAGVGSDEAMSTNEEAMTVVHSEVNDMAAQGGQRRELALELVDARVRVTDTETVRLRLETPALNGSLTYDTRALLYEVAARETRFVYALGHVYRVEGGGAHSERPPTFEMSGEQTRLVVPVLDGPTAGGPTSIGVSGTGERVLVAHRAGRPASVTRTGTGDAGVDTLNGTVTVEGSAHPSVWETALEATGFETVQTATREGGTVVSGRFETDQLTVQQADIRIALDGGRGG